MLNIFSYHVCHKKIFNSFSIISSKINMFTINQISKNSRVCKYVCLSVSLYVRTYVGTNPVCLSVCMYVVCTCVCLYVHVCLPKCMIQTSFGQDWISLKIRCTVKLQHKYPHFTNSTLLVVTYINGTARSVCPSACYFTAMTLKQQ